jgi:hypothetical protein
MADKKISALPAATALAGTEVVPVVQSGSTNKATIDQILSPAAGKGIDFSANGGDVLTQYDEGTWAIADTSGAGLSLTVDHAKYTRVGNLVTINAYVTYPVTVSVLPTSLSLPFTASKYDIGSAGASTGNVFSTITIGGSATTSLRNAPLQTVLNSTVSGADVLLGFTYMV